VILLHLTPFLFSTCQGLEVELDLLKNKSLGYAAAKNMAIQGIYSYPILHNEVPAG